MDMTRLPPMPTWSHRDWQQRPLQERCLQYAADDTRFLLPIAQRMGALTNPPALLLSQLLADTLQLEPRQVRVPASAGSTLEPLKDLIVGLSKPGMAEETSPAATTRGGETAAPAAALGGGHSYLVTLDKDGQGIWAPASTGPQMHEQEWSRVSASQWDAGRGGPSPLDLLPGW